jgi:Flp pilus assembly protein TadD
MTNRSPSKHSDGQQQQAQANAPTSIAAALQQAVTHHQSGRLAEAETLYRELLVRAPANFDVLHLLGVVHYQKGPASGSGGMH